LREEFGVNNNETLVGYLVRLTEQKDPITMINAIKIVLKETKDIKLLIVGNGDLESKIKDMVINSEIQNNVIFSNFREDIPNILNAIDIYCLPSLWEGMPIGLIEAMAMGKATISTAVDGTKELINNNNNGLSIPVGDANALANAILRTHYNKYIKEILGQNARKTITSRFNVTSMVNKLEDVYNNLLDNNSKYVLNQSL
jgi:glycosyltransferase involved in cell wall biosynthesis